MSKNFLYMLRIKSVEPEHPVWKPGQWLTCSNSAYVGPCFIPTVSAAHASAWNTKKEAEKEIRERNMWDLDIEIVAFEERICLPVLRRKSK